LTIESILLLKQQAVVVETRLIQCFKAKCSFSSVRVAIFWSFSQKKLSAKNCFSLLIQIRRN